MNRRAIPDRKNSDLPWTDLDDDPAINKIIMLSTSSRSPRYDWYQNSDWVIISIFVKGCPSTAAANNQQNHGEPVTVRAKENSVEVDILAPKQDDGDDYQTVQLKLHPLNQQIDPTDFQVKIFKQKVEIKLKKAISGIQWKSLVEASTEQVVNSRLSSAESQPGGDYSSQHKPKVKNWDALEKSLLEQQEAEEKPEGEQALNQLFQKIYGEGSDDVRKAMMKSFLESGGTCLSTNWDEVKQGKVEPKPPEGMEAKSWNSS